MEAIADPPAYDRACAAVRYDEIARALVLAFKYGDRLDLAPMMGRWMARAGRELLTDADALMPVPLHWRRLWARRFNQAATLAGTISGISGMPVLHGGIKRVRAMPQQVGLSRPERADNVRGAFRVPADQKAHIAGKRLVLIDDVPASGRHGRYLRPRPAAGRHRPYRRAGVRPGCRAGAHPHITSDRNPVRKPMPPIEIYTTRYCPYCHAAKALLSGKGVSFTEIDLAGNWERRDEMIERANGQVTVPQIFIGTVHVGGSDDLHALEHEGRLDALLAGEGQSA
jgi:GrxC family glutaredoxin